MTPKLFVLIIRPAADAPDAECETIYLPTSLYRAEKRRAEFLSMDPHGRVTILPSIG